MAVCVVTKEDTPCLLITRRAAGMRSHSSQWALPGGRREPGEGIKDAARRELAEETALETTPADVLGVLDDYATRSGYLMTPVVVWGGQAGSRLRRNAAEVARIHSIPLADFDVPPRLLKIPQSDRPVLQLPLLGRMVERPHGGDHLPVLPGRPARPGHQGGPLRSSRCSPGSRRFRVPLVFPSRKP